MDKKVNFLKQECSKGKSCSECCAVDLCITCFPNPFMRCISIIPRDMELEEIKEKIKEFKYE